MELSGLQIFKDLPAAKKAEHTNCKTCGFPTCMSFALKLAKGGVSPDACPFMPEDLREKVSHALKISQKTIKIQDIKIGGENVLFRHEKTFINPTALCILLDCDDRNFKEKLNRITDFEIKFLNKTKKVDLIVLKNSEHISTPPVNNRTISFEEFKKLPLTILEDKEFEKTAQKLKFIREKAVKEKDENYSNPVCVHFMSGGNSIQNFENLTAKASFYLCKYANMLLFEDFNEEMFASLMMLRENIFTDPQKPLKVEPKIYEFNGGDENALIFLTTNFALTFFAVAAELEKLNRPSYLIVTPADGMSVLTAWSAEKFTAKMVVKTLKDYDLASKVKTRKIIIPGLLAHMKKELDAEIQASNLDFEIVIGTIDACDIADFVKQF